MIGRFVGNLIDAKDSELFTASDVSKQDDQEEVLKHTFNS